MDPENVPAKFEVSSFTRSWYNFNFLYVNFLGPMSMMMTPSWSFGWGMRTPNIGEEEAVGVGDGAVRNSVGEFL